MKKLFLLLIISVSCHEIFGQQTAANPFPRTITVAGCAEMDIIPDQIYVNVALREYQKRGEEKKDLELLKSNFLGYCKLIGVPDSAISIASYTGFNNYYWLRKNKKKSPDLNAGITYQLVFSSSKQMDELIEKLDDEATQSFDIVNTSHSKMPEFRRQLKTGAVKAAKDKAIYLTEAINEKLGPAITITEPDETGNLTARLSNVSNGVFSQTRLDNNYRLIGEGDKTLEVDFKKIRLRYEVSVIFALQ
jgi:uncharacterized protein